MEDQNNAGSATKRDKVTVLHTDYAAERNKLILRKWETIEE